MLALLSAISYVIILGYLILHVALFIKHEGVKGNPIIIVALIVLAVPIIIIAALIILFIFGIGILSCF